MIISVNQQVSGHKVVVTETPPAGSGQRQASCQCGWRSPQGHTEQVMPAIRTHLDAAVAAKPRASGRPSQRKDADGIRRQRLAR
jgi:hypothetical protein